MSLDTMETKNAIARALCNKDHDETCSLPLCACHSSMKAEYLFEADAAYSAVASQLATLTTELSEARARVAMAETKNPVGWVVDGVFYGSRVEADRAYRRTPSAPVTPILVSDVVKMASALKGLIDACSCVRPLSGDVAMDTVKDMRQAMSFMEAVDAARAVLGSYRG